MQDDNSLHALLRPGAEILSVVANSCCTNRTGSKKKTGIVGILNEAFVLPSTLLVK